MSANTTISISYKLEEAGDGFNKAIIKAEDLREMLKSAVKQVEQLKAPTINFAALATSIDSVNNSLYSLQNTLKGLTDAYAAQIEAETQLATTMRNTMGARESDIQSIKDLCSEQQKLGVIGDEVQLAGAQELATYLSEKQSLEKLIPVMNDMLAQQYGLNASQENASQIATMLGKVMDGQTGALSRYGYSFDAAQEKILKYGTEAERAAVLCEVVESSVGGMNAALAKTDAGKLKQAENNIGDFKEKIGGIVQSLMPLLTIGISVLAAVATIVKLVHATKIAYTAIKDVCKAVKSWHVGQKALNAAMILGTGDTKKAAQAMRLYTNTVKGGRAHTIAFGTALRGLAIGAGILGAIGGLITLICLLSGKSKDAADATAELIDEEKRAQREAENTEQLRQSENSALVNSRAELAINISKLKDFNGTKEQEKKLVSEMNSTYGDTMGYFSSVSDWYKALTENSETYCKQMILEARTRTLANQIGTKQQENADIEDNIRNNRYSKEEKYSIFNALNTEAITEHLNGDGQGDILKSMVLATKMPSDYESAQKALADNNAEIERLNAQMTAAIKETQDLDFKITGSTTEPTFDDPKAEKTRLQQLKELISKSKEEYVTASETKREQIRKDIAGWKDEIRVIEQLQKEAERPSNLDSFQAIDDEIAYQQELRRHASQENISAIDTEIKRLTDLRREKEQSAHTPLAIEDIKTYEQLDTELSYYNGLLKTCGETEREEIQKKINELNDLKETWDATLAELKKPAEISALNSIKDLDEAIRYYQQKQSEATGEEIQNIQQTIDEHERKRSALQRGIDLPKMQREADEINSLNGKEYKVKIRGMGFDALTEKIKDLKRMLNDTENPVTDTQREQINGLISTYEQWRKESIDTFGAMRSSWEGMKGIGSGIEGITQAIEGNGNAWQTLTSIVDGFLQIYDGIKAIVDIINMMTAATDVSKTATEGETAATMENTAAEITNTAASVTNTSVKSGEAIAEATASGAKLPFPANLIAIAAGVAAVISALSAVGCFASGGIVGGNSLSGDKLLARVNSGEMILNSRQQKNLFRMLNTQQSIRGVQIANPNYTEVSIPFDKLDRMLNEGRAETGPGRVEFEIRGDRLYGLLRRHERMLDRT